MPWGPRILSLLSFLPISVLPVQAEITRSSKEAQRGIALFQMGELGKGSRIGGGQVLGYPAGLTGSAVLFPAPGPCPKGPCG